jgi:predicted RNase H-like nuclease
MTAQQILERQKASADASPAKSLVTDLAQLRRTLRITGRAYLQRLEANLDDVAAWAKLCATNQEPAKSQIRDLSDMVTLVRKIDVKAQKGRRKDLKKIDTTICELCEMIAQCAPR